MNKQELQRKYQEIELKTNGGNDDYVVALCQIANAINELDEPKQDTKWQKLKEFIKTYQEDVDWKNKQVDEIQEEILDKMQELEGEDE